MNFKSSGTLCALFLSAVCAAGINAEDDDQPAVPVITVPATMQDIALTLDTTGSVEAFSRVTVHSKVTGIIEQLLVERGMKVSKGDPIAVVEHKTELAQRKVLLAAVEAARVAIRQADAAVRVARAALQQAEAQLENATLEKTRAENLYKDESIPKQQYDAAMVQYRVAVAGRDLASANLGVAEAAHAQAAVGLKQAEASLEHLDVRIDEYTIRSPINGVCTARFVDEGTMANPSLPLVEIMDTSTLKINCDIAQINAWRVRKGQEVLITTDALPGIEVKGTVSIINPSLDPDTRTLPIEIHTNGRPTSDEADTNAVLMPGMFAFTSINLGTKNGLVVPRDCLMRLPGTGVYYLFVIEDDKAEKRTVELGLSRGNLVEITNGVQSGEHVVIQGQVNLITGTPVVETQERARSN